MEYATTQSDRLALIKKISERKKKLAAVKSKTRKMRVPKANRSFMDVPKESNMYQWTDASKYAKEYYGETLHYTTKFDNDWD